MDANDVVKKAWEIMPQWAKEQWLELSTADNRHDWISDTLKQGLVRMYKSLNESLKNSKLELIEIAGIISLQSDILECIGFCEVYLSDSIKEEVRWQIDH